MFSKHTLGIKLALITALVSGFSVYVNAFGNKAVGEPFVYTTLKNTLVALLLTVVIIGARQIGRLTSLNRGQWLRLLTIGVVGGSVPFLLFFYGASIATPASAAVIHKSLFLWVALLAVPFLGEKIGRWTWAGLVTLGLGVVLFNLTSVETFVGAAVANGFKTGELYILLGTLLWSVETILAKQVLTDLPAALAAWARMFFGMIVMWGFVLFTGRAGAVFTLDLSQWGWIALTSAFLFGYVTSWYHALRVAPATVVTSVLTIGAVITVALQAMLDGQTLVTVQYLGAVLMLGGVALLLKQQPRVDKAIHLESAK